MLPEMREETMDLKKERLERPLLTEERIAEIEIILREAAYGKKSIRGSYYNGEKLVNFRAQRVVLLPSGFIGLDGITIHYSQIADAESW